MGLFSKPRRKKSIAAQINREKKLIKKKQMRAELEKLRKQRRGY
jgi:hypothetical protein